MTTFDGLKVSAIALFSGLAGAAMHASLQQEIIAKSFKLVDSDGKAVFTATTEDGRAFLQLRPGSRIVLGTDTENNLMLSTKPDGSPSIQLVEPGTAEACVFYMSEGHPQLNFHNGERTELILEGGSRPSLNLMREGEKVVDLGIKSAKSANLAFFGREAGIVKTQVGVEDDEAFLTLWENLSESQVYASLQAEKGTAGLVLHDGEGKPVLKVLSDKSGLASFTVRGKDGEEKSLIPPQK